MPLHIIRGDITRVRADAVVNAANQYLSPGGGVCGAIFAAAGREDLEKACLKIGHCPTGRAVATPAFRLPAKYLIHAVGPVWQGGYREEEKLLRGAYLTSLELAKEHGCRSIAFPLISAGLFGYPVEAAWERAICACRDFLDRHPENGPDIIFAVLDNKIIEIGEAVLQKCR